MIIPDAAPVIFAGLRLGVAAGFIGVVLAELLGASKTFGTGAAAVHAVVDVDLAVRAGELLAVLGPNGAGKTTALSMLTGLSTPSSGTARLFGRDPRDLAARPHLSPRDEVPPWMRQLSYDQLRRIEFDGRQSLWHRDGRRFQVQFLHPGFLHDRMVRLAEVRDGRATPVVALASRWSTR